jgi:hypothetical protein
MTRTLALTDKQERQIVVIVGRDAEAVVQHRIRRVTAGGPIAEGPWQATDSDLIVVGAAESAPVTA